MASIEAGKHDMSSRADTTLYRAKTPNRRESSSEHRCFGIIRNASVTLRCGPCVSTNIFLTGHVQHGDRALGPCQQEDQLLVHHVKGACESVSRGFAGGHLMPHSTNRIGSLLFRTQRQASPSAEAVSLDEGAGQSWPRRRFEG